MAANDSERMLLGEMNGKLDALITSVGEWRAEHNDRHVKIDEQIAGHAADINKAKGAKAALFVAATAISTLVSAAWAAGTHFFK